MDLLLAVERYSEKFKPEHPLGNGVQAALAIEILHARATLDRTEPVIKWTDPLKPKVRRWRKRPK